MPWVGNQWIPELDPTVMRDPTTFGVDPQSVAAIAAYRGMSTPGIVPQNELPMGVGVGAGTGLIAAIPPALAAVGVPAAVAGLGGLVAGYFLGDGGNGGGAVATSGGGGGGVVAPSGGGDYLMGNVVMQGPGLKEPHPAIIAKMWSIVMDSKQGDFRLVFYRLRDGRVMSYNQRTGIWKIWRPKKNLVLSKNPRIPELLKAAKFIDNTFLRLEKRMTKYRKRTKRR